MAKIEAFDRSASASRCADRAATDAVIQDACCVPGRQQLYQAAPDVFDSAEAGADFHQHQQDVRQCGFGLGALSRHQSRSAQASTWPELSRGCAQLQALTGRVGTRITRCAHAASSS